jgi:hypothetical protein
MFTFDYVPAEDETVDDEYVLLQDQEDTGVSIQVSEGVYYVNHHTYGKGFPVRHCIGMRTISEHASLKEAKAQALEFLSTL